MITRSNSKGKGSNVTLRGTAAAKDAMKIAKKVTRVKDKTDKLQAELKKIDKKMKRINEEREKARARLDAAVGRAKEAKQRLNAFVAEADTVEGDVMRSKPLPLPTFQDAYNAVNLKPVGASYNTKEILENKSILSATDKAALEVQKLTKCDMTASEIAEREYQARQHGTEGRWRGYKRTDETRKNVRGDDANLNQSIVATAQYEYEASQGTGLPKYNAEKSHNFKTEIPKMAKRWQVIKMLPDGEGFELLPPPEDSSLSYLDVQDCIAKFLRCKDFRHFTAMLNNTIGEMGGMDRERFVGENILEYKGQYHPSYPQYAAAAYRFKFKPNNKTRFEVS